MVDDVGALKAAYQVSLKQTKANEEAAKVKASAKAKDEANAKLRAHFSQLGVNADKTKSITRLVNGQEKTVVYGKDENGEKVYLDAETGEQLVTKTTVGKNTFITKKEADAVIMQMLGTTSVPKGVTVKYVTDENGTTSPILLFRGEKLDAKGMQDLAILTTFNDAIAKQDPNELKAKDVAAAAKTTELTNGELADAIAKDAKTPKKGGNVEAILLKNKEGKYEQYTIDNFVADVKSGKLSKSEINEAMKQFGLPQEIAKDEVAKEVKEIYTAEQIKEIDAISKDMEATLTMDNDLAMTSVPKKRNADGVYVQGAGSNETDKTHKLRRLPKGVVITGKAKADKAKVDAYFEHQKELQTNKAGKDSLTAAEAVKMGLKPFDNNGSYIYEHKPRNQGTTSENELLPTTVYHKIVVGNTAIYVKQGTQPGKINELKNAELARQQRAEANRQENTRRQRAAGDNGFKMGTAARNGVIDKNVMHEHLRNINKLSDKYTMEFLKNYKKASYSSYNKNGMNIISQLATYNSSMSKQAALKLLKGAQSANPGNKELANLIKSMETSPNWIEFAKSADKMLQKLC